MKELPPSKDSPSTFHPIPCIGSKFTRISNHPGTFTSVFVGVGEPEPQVLWMSEVRNFVLYFTEGYYKAAWIYLMWCAPRLHHAHDDLVPFRVFLCCQALTLKLLIVPLYIIFCLIICFEGIESL